jgi:glutamine amidotransferase PdxT
MEYPEVLSDVTEGLDMEPCNAVFIRAPAILKVSDVVTTHE